MDEPVDRTEISAEPTKAFFVEMLVLDIPLEQAVLDLVDNSVDGAKRYVGNGDKPFEGRFVRLEFSKERFRLVDNCGGFDTETARDYAFRFGRPDGMTRTPHSIGQFGVGMKRALFKFGKQFVVRSATEIEEWGVDVDVEEWEKIKGWTFPWSNFETDGVPSKNTPGTEIIVSRLKPEVAGKFATHLFINSIIGLIKSKHRQFISEGLSITVNGAHIDATSLYLLMRQDGLKSGVDFIQFTSEDKEPVNVKIVVGLGPSLPREAGWYVICNGRVVLEADRRPVTGWGLLEDQVARAVIPSFHNQFARFRGIASFDSNDSARVPWNTTKTDVDQDSPVWRKTFERMAEMMKPVIAFLNELDHDIDEYTREKSPLLDFITKSIPQKPESLVTKASFTAPARGTIVTSPRTVKIQYSRPVEDVAFLEEALNLTSAKAVGERTFDIVMRRQQGK